MLIKLFKYEFKATYKFFLFAFALIIGLSLLMFITGGKSLGRTLSSTYASYAETSIIYIFLLFIYVIVCAVAAAAIIIYSVIRFYQSLLGSEGYITHTLPVKTGSLIIVKNLTMTVWIFLTAAVISVCSYALFKASLPGMIFTMNYDAEIKTLLGQISKAELTGITVLAVINFLALFSKTLMTVYASMTVGYSFNKGRKLKSFLIYLILQYISQAVSNTAVSLLHIDSLNYGFSALTGAVNISLIASLLLTLAITAVMFFIALYFLKNRLNLQ